MPNRFKTFEHRKSALESEGVEDVYDVSSGEGYSRAYDVMAESDVCYGVAHVGLMHQAEQKVLIDGSCLRHSSTSLLCYNPNPINNHCA
jgi:hypothetical protein